MPYSVQIEHQVKSFRYVCKIDSGIISRDRVLITTHYGCYSKERLKRFDKTKEDFSLLVNEFDLILDMYNEHCVCKPVREIRAIGREKVDEETKDNYKKQKGAYELFLRNYMDFGKKLNKEFLEIILKCRENCRNFCIRFSLQQRLIVHP